MSVSYPIPFGPTFNPLFEPEGLFFWDDFIGSSLSATANAATWVNVSSSGVDANIASSEPNGALTLNSNDLTDDAGVELNGEPFAFDHGKDFAVGVRFKVDVINGADLFFGLHTEAFDVGSGASLVSTHIGFLTTGSANLLFSVADGSSQTTQDTTYDLVADTYVNAVWKFNAATGVIRFYIDGDLKGTMSVADDFLPASGTQLTLGLHCEYHSATTVATVDYVFAGGER